MRSIPAVRAGNNIAAGAGRSAWTSMAQGAAIGQSGAERPIGVEIPNAVAFIRSLPLQSRELALKELATTADGAKGIALDDEDRGIPSLGVAASRARFILQGFCDTRLCGIRCLSLIG